MNQPITEDHKLDADGNPAGGSTRGIGLAIDWQDGPLGRGADRNEPNGAFVEGVIKAAIGRLEFYQGGPFHCLHNAVALGYLNAALGVLGERTRDREGRGVEGPHSE